LNRRRQLNLHASTLACSASRRRSERPRSEDCLPFTLSAAMRSAGPFSRAHQLPRLRWEAPWARGGGIISRRCAPLRIASSFHARHISAARSIAPGQSSPSRAAHPFVIHDLENSTSAFTTENYTTANTHSSLSAELSRVRHPAYPVEDAYALRLPRVSMNCCRNTQNPPSPFHESDMATDHGSIRDFASFHERTSQSTRRRRAAGPSPFHESAHMP
jgi:hypothetical protein